MSKRLGATGGSASRLIPDLVTSYSWSYRDTYEILSSVIGKEIAALELTDERPGPHLGHSQRLLFTFSDGTMVEMFDAGQQCSEYRYIHTDDDLQAFIGARLLAAEIRDAPDRESTCGEYHNVQFLIVTTTLGAFTMETHNEHNGAYGGFLVCIAEVTS